MSLAVERRSSRRFCGSHGGRLGPKACEKHCKMAAGGGIDVVDYVLTVGIVASGSGALDAAIW